MSQQQRPQLQLLLLPIYLLQYPSEETTGIYTHGLANTVPLCDLNVQVDDHFISIIRLL
jgi:hypothetical protein